MTQARTGKANWYLATAGFGVLLGSVIWFVVGFTSDQEPSEVEPTGSGRVAAKLGEQCALVDEALLERLYGKGKAKPGNSSDPETDTECEWAASPTYVHIEADLEDYPEDGEAGAAAAEFAYDLANAEEGDPVRGLPEKLTGLGDEAYVVYDPKTEKGRKFEEEEAELRLRRGNILLTITVRRAAKSSAVGHDRMVEDARKVAAAAVAELP